MVRAVLLVFLVALAAGCSRPLASGERAFARDIFGAGLDVDRVRVAAGLGLAPLPTRAPPPPEQRVRKVAPGLCDRVAPSPPEGPPPAFALWNRVHLSRQFYRPDTMANWPDKVMLPQALILAHEIVHVWQWQNRGMTGYRPVRAAAESFTSHDPYFYVPQPGEGFLKFGYEQQASLLEDYLCYAMFDPRNPRRTEIRAIIAPHFQVDRIDAALAR